MKYARFKTEHELLKSILGSMPYDAYPQVSAIGGKKINPDIDILKVQKISQTQFRLIGCEVKLIKFDNRSKRLSWSGFYNGIGQALLYLKNGVHQAVLVLGFHESILDDKAIDQFHEWLWDNKDLLKRILGNYLSIVLHLYERNPISPLIEATSDFYASDEKVRLLSDEILHKKFTFNKRLRVN
jgi:hypothetical protein